MITPGSVSRFRNSILLAEQLQLPAIALADAPSNTPLYKRRLAAVYMSRERPNHTLQETALVHEAYLKLLPQRVNWESVCIYDGN
jgi:hypothetical protein